MASQPTDTPKRGSRAHDRKPGEPSHPLLLLIFTALCVARPLLPSEGVSWMGDGQPFDMLWLLLAAAYCLSLVAQGRRWRRFDMVDAATVALMVVFVVSDLIAMRVASPRFSINMLFEWVALGVLFLLTRQLVTREREARALIAVMATLAIVLSAFGLYEVFAPLATNAANAVHGAPAPLATFAASGSLAGFLVPWLLMLVAVAVNQVTTRPRLFLPLVMTWAGALSVALVVVLTKSVSAYAAVVVGLILLGVASAKFRESCNWKIAAAGAAGLALILGVAGATKPFDSRWLSSTQDSFERLGDYWRTTLDVIGDNALVGVGPGNFQDYYVQNMPPDSSEAIRSPRNLLLEVWATGGAFALVALLEAIGLVCWRSWHAPENTEPAEPRSGSQAPARPRSAKFMVAGFPAGCLLAFVVGPWVGLALSEERLAGGILLGAIVLSCLWPWITRGSTSGRWAAVAAIGLMVHLLATDGITYPGVAGTLWILFALALGSFRADQQSEPRAKREDQASPLTTFALLAFCAVSLASIVWGCGPIVRYRAAMNRVEDLAGASVDKRLAALRDAGEADPRNAEPWAAIAQLRLSTMKADAKSPEALDETLRAIYQMIADRPRSSAAWQQAGEWFMKLHELYHDPQDAKTAAGAFERAVQWHPNSAEAHARRALALAECGERKTAANAAKEALRLNDEAPGDRKLSEDMTKRLLELREGPR